jgi:hypothetical protein
MADIYKDEPTVSPTLAELTEETTRALARYKTPCCPPAIDPEKQLKWGLALLGEEKAREYVQWLRSRLDNSIL